MTSWMRWGLCGAMLCATLAQAQPNEEKPMSKPILGMYVHQHWSYNHPYAARTWTLDDWRGYCDGLKRLGFNTVLIWPVLETMPDPLTDSDKENLDKIARVIDMLHNEFDMRAYIVLCPNVSPKSEIARQYTFQERPFFHTDDRVDPGDPEALGRLIRWRETLLRPLAKMDGLFIIDSDPGGWPNSTNLEFVYLLDAHRGLLNEIRPGIELVYWIAFGWEGYGRFYATGELDRGGPEEIHDAIKLLAKEKPEPWWLASAWGPDIADPIGMGDRVLAFNYGAIEGEPSFPLTIFDTGYAYDGGKNKGQRGVLGNSQTHCVQLPNTFALSRGAQGLPCEEADYVAFAEDLIPGQGRLIVDGWKALQGTDSAAKYAVADQLAALPAGSLQPGPLKGFLFGDPARFIDDLVLQLRASGTMEDFRAAVFAEPQDRAKVVETFKRFIAAVEAWQTKHGYKNHWYWPTQIETLRKLDMPVLNETLDTLRWVGEGPTPFEAVKNGLAALETYTPRLIEAMHKAVEELGERENSN